jgi:hypothetical protein
LKFQVSFEPEERSAGGVGLAFRLRMGRRSRRLHAFASAGPVSALADFVLPLVLPAAMHHGATLEIDRPLSPSTASRLAETMAYLARWDRRLQPVPVLAGAPACEEAAAGAAASFFSGGVDSFYSLLTHLAELEALVFLHGYDIRRAHARLGEQAVSTVKAAALHFDKEVVEVDSNWRSLLDEYVEWEPQGHRLFLAAAGLLLAPRFGRIYVPAGYVSDDLVPARTDPGFYPAWSRPNLRLLADGVNAARVQKVELVANSQVALDGLRVCWENCGGAYNCGRCEKCLRTMATLRILGVLDRCPTFTHPLDLDALARVYVYDDNLAAYLRENLELLRSRGGDPELERALVSCLRPRGPVRRRFLSAGWLARRVLLGPDRGPVLANALRKRTHWW